MQPPVLHAVGRGEMQAGRAARFDASLLASSRVTIKGRDSVSVCMCVCARRERPLKVLSGAAWSKGRSGGWGAGRRLSVTEGRVEGTKLGSVQRGEG